MEEERVRYKAVVTSGDIFLSNLQFYMGSVFKERTEKSTKKITKQTRSFLLPSSYRIYEGLEAIGEDIATLETSWSLASNL